MKKIIALALALVSILCLFGCKKEEEAAEAPAVILQSEHYTVTVAEYGYFFASTYDEFASQYGDMINYMIDTKKPLRDQKCPVDQTGKMTWFDYIADGATESIKSYLYFAEKAIDEGVEISAEDKAFIEESLGRFKEFAREGGYASVDDYVKDRYGEFATVDTVRTCLELSTLANTYRNKIYTDATYTDEDFLAYAEKNPDKCYSADFMYMKMNTTVTDKMTDEEKTKAWEKTQSLATAFSEAAKDEATFIEQAEKYLRSICTVVEDQSKADPSNNIYTEAQLKEQAKGARTEGVQYATGAPNVDWIFKAGRKAGDMTVIKDDKAYTCEIIMMLKPAYLTEQPTVDVRHILISLDKAGDDYKAGAKAEEILEKWKSGDATEISFGVLAAENSDDQSSVNSGGLYSDIVPGQMAKEFNDWCFDEERKAGDTGIIKADYGYHVMYFVEKGMPKWRNEADKGLREATVTKLLEELKGGYEITFNEDNIAKCPDLFGE